MVKMLEVVLRLSRGSNGYRHLKLVVSASVLLCLGMVLSSCGKSPSESPSDEITTPNEPKMVETKALPHVPSVAEVTDLKQCRDLVHTGKYKDALPLCETAVKQYPGNAEAKYLMAYCLQTTNQRLEEAVTLYDQAEQGGFTKFWIHYNRGLLYLWGIKDKEKAKADLERALALDSTGSHRSVILNLLKNIK